MVSNYRREISSEKELFLAICMIAGSIGKETIAAMIKDMGESKVRSTIIHTLKRNKYIKKIGNHESYDYIITSAGIDYLRDKCPNKYNYLEYEATVADEHKYETRIRRRRRIGSLILYSLYKEGVSITDHSKDFKRIVKGETVNLGTPYFITPKEFAKAHSRLLTSLGSKMYGVIVARSCIFLVYSPETRNHVFSRHEDESVKTVTSILRNAKPPYNQPSNTEILFMYKDSADVVASFKRQEKQKGRNASTYNFYENLAMKNSYIYSIKDNPYRLSEIFDINYLKDVTVTFCNHFKIAPQRIQGYDYLHVVGTCHEDGKEYVTYSLWTFSPTALVCALNYAANNKLGDNQKIMLMCYEKQIDWIKQILTAKQEYRNKFRVAFLHYQSMNDYINGITDFVE